MNCLINITLTGLLKPIVVNGVEYDGEMSGYQHLDNKAIKDILNYIGTKFKKNLKLFEQLIFCIKKKEL